MSIEEPDEEEVVVRPRRADHGRRLTFTQSPGTAAYVEKLAAQTGLSKADLYNAAMRAVEAMLPALAGSSAARRGLILQDVEPGVRAALGDILASISKSRHYGRDQPFS